MAKPNYAFEKRQKELAKKKKKEEKEAAKAHRKTVGGPDVAEAPEGAAGAPGAGSSDTPAGQG